MLNLKNFELNSKIESIKDDFYKKFIKKLLKKNLDYIYLSLNLNYDESNNKLYLTF